MSFEKLNLIEPVLRALKAEGYTQPTPIQEEAIPILLQRKDLLGCAQTGTGKTAAFAIPILQLLYQDELYKKWPAGIKTLFFSANEAPEICELDNYILTNPVRVQVSAVSSTANTVVQSLYFVEKSDKRSLLLHLLKQQSIETALVFTRTKHGADKVAKDLNRAGVQAEAIHGNKSQNARQRALSNFKAKQTRVLVATDIAARGIDIDDLSHVVNYELPNIPETYVHRIGRTGRAGASGIALSFCDTEEKEFLRDIHKLIARTIPVVEDHPYHSTSNATRPSVGL